MSELDDFLKWGATVRENGERDQFGKLMEGFPYGSLSYWINEYKRSQNKQRF